MKSTTLLALSILLFAFSAQSTPDQVLDAHGKDLRAGVDYYIMPAARDGSSGGITLGAATNHPCPLVPAQFRTDEWGLPLTFSPVSPKKGVIRLSTDVNIIFSGFAACNQSNVWKIGYDKAMKQHAVTLGGMEGNPGKKTLDSWFKIEKSMNGYKIVFCPSVCKFCKVTCKDIGIVEDGIGMRRLAPNNIPFEVIFEH